MRIAKIIQTYTIILLIALAVAGAARAATTLGVGIPGVEGAAPGDTVSSVPMYIKYLYYFVLGLVGIAGFSSLVFWGAVWAGSGVVDKKAQAISGIKNTLTGIGIALTAFILLNTINPDLIVIKMPDVASTTLSPSTESNRCGQFRNSTNCMAANCYWYNSMCSNIRSIDQQTYIRPKTATVTNCNFSGGKIGCGQSYQKEIKGGKWQCESFLSFTENTGQLFSIVAGAAANICGKSIPDCKAWCVAY